MKKLFLNLKTIIAAVLVASTMYAGANANVQVIHNCADPLAASVDVYVNGNITLNDFAFRTATPFVSLPSGVPISIAIAPSNSTSVGDALATFNYDSLANNQNYTIIASGVVGTGFAANPNSLSTAFTLNVLGGARTAATNAGEVDFNVFHGATDAPGVDVTLSNGGALLVNNLKYGSGTPYLSVPAGSYLIDLLVEDSSATVNTYVADLSGLAGGAATILASGFLTLSANNNGASFELIAVLADATVVTLPVYVAPKAKVQVIHNCADPLAAIVDVYINGDLAINNFVFRNATPFIELNAGVPVSIAIAPSNSTSVGDALATFNYDSLQRNQNYTIIASGVVGTGFAANPNSLSTAFTLNVLGGARTAATNAGEVDFNVFHGATDAPGVDVTLSNGGALLVNNLRYGSGTPYLSVPAASYLIDLLVEDSSATVNTYVADLSGLVGGAATVLASGFLTPSANNNGPAFELIAVLADGNVVLLPVYVAPTANVQVIHNCADPLAATVDVYINGDLAIDNFAFRTATPFIPLPAGVPVSIAVAAPNSTSVGDALATFNYDSLERNINYTITASGVVGTGFAPNPDGENTGFQLLVNAPSRTAAVTAGNFEFFVIHGTTDAPTVDIKVMGGATIVDNAAYTDQTPYLSVPAASYVLEVQDGTGSVTLRRYVADVTTLAGQSGTVLASGFLTPALNNNGPAFGAYLVTAAGGNLIALPEYVETSINDLNSEINLSMMPNPTAGNLTFNFNLENTERVTIDITNVNGQIVKQVLNETVNGNQTINTNVSDLSNGIYFARITSGTQVSNNKFIVAK